MSEFSFSRGSYQNLPSLSRQPSNLTAVNSNEPEPMELVVQSVIGTPLDNTYTALQTLHESQVVLIARIKILEEKVKRYRETLKNTAEVPRVDEVQAVVRRLREKLTNIKAKISVVEQRLAVIEHLTSDNTASANDL